MKHNFFTRMFIQCDPKLLSLLLELLMKLKLSNKLYFVTVLVAVDELLSLFVKR